MLYTLTVNGKSQQIKAISAETAARSEMCWYTYGTLLTVTDENGNINSYRKIKSNNNISGYAELKKV